MSLGDFIGRLDVSMFPQLALLIFLGVFVVLSIRAMTLSRRLNVSEAAQLPLEDGTGGETEVRS